VLGEPLRYRRLTAAESAELRTALTEIQAAIDTEMSADADAAVADPSPPLSDEETANDLACMNEGLRLPRSEAIAACTALLASTNLVPEALAIVRTNRGNHLTDDGQYDLAIADYEEALRLNPEYGMAYRGRAAVHEGRGDFARAAADSREAARREPGDATVLNSLCWHLALAGEALDEARNACDASLALRPDDPATLDSRGLVGLKQGRFAEAHADFDAAVRHGEGDGGLASFVYGRGIAALRLGRTAEGQADLARAAALDASIAETYVRHGVRP
jgi:tetratricopeptide (TPR) repeat protein